jgi:nitroreductase
VESPFDTAETDRLLTTTRSVRKRLDLERPVPREVILECLDLALQAPSAQNTQTWRWVVVTDPDKRAEVGRLYASTAQGYLEQALAGELDAGTRRAYESSLHLCKVIHLVPALVIPCVLGRLGKHPNPGAMYGSIVPAAWSFMLALRSRGLGSAWTTGSLYKEREIAEVLGIPYEEYTQAALLPVAYTKGTDFKRGTRMPATDVTFWDHWGSPVPTGSGH